jgi:hypothetical protein
MRFEIFAAEKRRARAAGDVHTCRQLQKRL